jgi:hypothetical protein
MSQIENQYFDWMCRMVASKKYKTRFYRELLHFLHGIEFTYTIAMDGNRASDGIDLRYRFGYEEGYDNRLVTHYLDDKPCSVLEMLVALSMRCEETIMSDGECDRTGVWFWSMLNNLGLTEMDDSHFNERKAYDIIQRFLDREYSYYGEGGLVTVKNPGGDMRTAEIWYQNMWYLDEVLESI